MTFRVSVANCAVGSFLAAVLHYGWTGGFLVAALTGCIPDKFDTFNGTYFSATPNYGEGLDPSPSRSTTIKAQADASKIADVALIVIEVETSSSGIPSNSRSIKSEFLQHTAIVPHMEQKKRPPSRTASCGF